jgi:hypothetical protein
MRDPPRDPDPPHHRPRCAAGQLSNSQRFTTDAIGARSGYDDVITGNAGDDGEVVPLRARR